MKCTTMGPAVPAEERIPRAGDASREPRNASDNLMRTTVNTGPRSHPCDA